MLQEFYATVTRILKVPLPPKEVMAFLDRFHAFPLVATDFSLVTEGIRNSVKFQVSFWDGAVIAAAERLKAKTFYSEDLNVGRCCGEVTIVNPFVVSSDPRYWTLSRTLILLQDRLRFQTQIPLPNAPIRLRKPIDRFLVRPLLLVVNAFLARPIPHKPSAQVDAQAMPVIAHRV